MPAPRVRRARCCGGHEKSDRRWPGGRLQDLRDARTWPRLTAAPPASGTVRVHAGEPSGPGPAAPAGQPSAKTTVTETLSCCEPGEIGTDLPAAADAAGANTGTGPGDA